MAFTLRQLTSIIAQNVEKVIGIYDDIGVPLPTLDVPSPPNAALASNADLVQSITLVQSAASQLLATIIPSRLIIAEAVMGFNLTGALGVIEAFHIAEIIREGHPSGMHINEIGMKANQDPAKIGRLLRLLATSYIFKEVAPNVFAHNRNSAPIDTGKTLDEIKARPLEKYTNSNGLSAAIGASCELTSKASAYLTETFKDPATAFQYSPNYAAFCRAIGTNKNVFEWLKDPENERCRKRFGVMMKATTASPESVLGGWYDWKSLSEGSVVVDVGGGIGSDQLEVVEDGLKAWKEHSPNILDNHQVTFQVQDFFEQQPADLPPPSVYFLRQIIHDWADEWCIKILKQLRANASPQTKLIVSDILIKYACRIPPEDGVFTGIPGGVPVPAPEPLLTNFGRGAGLAYTMDYVMMVLHNAQERTVGQFIKLGQESGWQLTSVHTPGNSAHAYLIFEPM